MIGAVATAAVSTSGDYLWKNALPHGQPIYWFAHAIVLFATVGACLGWPSRKVPAGGARRRSRSAAAATRGFYVLQPLMGYSAMFLPVRRCCGWGWALLTGRVLQGRRGRMADVLVAQAALAAIGSGLGFYVISGIWMPFNPHGCGLREALRLLDDRVSARRSRRC